MEPVRLIVLGDRSVGKTQMMMRYTENTFSRVSQTTPGVDFKLKVTAVDGVTRKIQIWDTAGQERFRTIVETFYRRAQGIVLVYDVTTNDSFNALREWFESIGKFAVPGTPIIMCGNKTDLEATVDPDAAHDLATEKGCELRFTSAATGEGIDEVFLAIVRKALANTAARPRAGAAADSPGRHRRRAAAVRRQMLLILN
jgi:small GTP-binding protein